MSAQGGTHVPRSRVVAGIDEAGLGPLLGPLAIGWSVFRLPEPTASPWQLLRPLVGKRPHRRARLVVADSKKVFQRSEAGERRLETTALGFLSLLQGGGRVPSDAAELLFGPLRPSPELVREHPWYGCLPPLPRALSAESLELTAALLARRMSAQGLELLDAGVRLVPSGELNASYGRTHNKGTTVWHRCAEVLGHLWREHGSEGPRVTVDLLGGRMHYAGPLASAFPDARVEVRHESPRRCAYVLDEDGPAARTSWLPRRMEVEFLAQGEDASFAVALASCIAKYSRELVMHAFNAYFGARQPELPPTAGYTTDGRRWLAEAGPAIGRSGVRREILVRER